MQQKLFKCLHAQQWYHNCLSRHGLAANVADGQTDRRINLSSHSRLFRRAGRQKWKARLQYCLGSVRSPFDLWHLSPVQTATPQLCLTGLPYINMRQTKPERSLNWSQCQVQFTREFSFVLAIRTRHRLPSPSFWRDEPWLLDLFTTSFAWTLRLTYELLFI